MSAPPRAQVGWLDYDERAMEPCRPAIHSGERPPALDELSRLRCVQRGQRTRQVFERKRGEDRERASAGENVLHPPVFAHVKTTSCCDLHEQNPTTGKLEKTSRTKVADVLQVFDDIFRCRTDGLWRRANLDA